MTTIEHLQRIKSRCQELLVTAETRTPGRHYSRQGRVHNVNGCTVASCNKPDYTDSQCEHNATFIASCAGPAEAGWRATIAAVDCALVILEFYEGSHLNDVQKRELDTANDSALAIIVAWPEEVLN